MADKYDRLIGTYRGNLSSQVPLSPELDSIYGPQFDSLTQAYDSTLDARNQASDAYQSIDTSPDISQTLGASLGAGIAGAIAGAIGGKRVFGNALIGASGGAKEYLDRAMKGKMEQRLQLAQNVTDMDDQLRSLENQANQLNRTATGVMAKQALQSNAPDSVITRQMVEDFNLPSGAEGQPQSLLSNYQRDREHDLAERTQGRLELKHDMGIATSQMRQGETAIPGAVKRVNADPKLVRDMAAEIADTEKLRGGISNLKDEIAKDPEIKLTGTDRYIRGAMDTFNQGLSRTWQNLGARLDGREETLMRAFSVATPQGQGEVTTFTQDLIGIDRVKFLSALEKIFDKHMAERAAVAGHQYPGHEYSDYYRKKYGFLTEPEIAQQDYSTQLEGIKKVQDFNKYKVGGEKRVTVDPVGGQPSPSELAAQIRQALGR